MNEWVWTSGTNTVNCSGGQQGVYGTLGSAAASNIPGGRAAAVSWTDTNGTLWLFGGNGLDGTGKMGYLNDLWEYVNTGGEWVWMGGSSTSGQPGVYGTLGKPAAGVIPGGRFNSTSWSDSSGNFWFFGGLGIDDSDTVGSLNDMWEYEVAAGTGPAIQSVTAVTAQQTQTFTITGSGFGTRAAYSGDALYIAIVDESGATFQAGYVNSGVGVDDAVGLSISSWTDTQIVITGFTGDYGPNGWSLSQGDHLVLSIWNVQTDVGPGICANIFVGSGLTHCKSIQAQTPTITWATPAPITYGTPLSATQLDASSGGVAGSFLYTPPAGTVLQAGTQTLLAGFTPTDATDYSPTSASVELIVNKATPVFGTMTFAPVATEPYGTNQAVTISDTLSYSGGQPGGAVTYVLNLVSYTATCTAAGSPETCSATVPAATIAALAVGAHIVTGSFAGDNNYTVATASNAIFAVTVLAPTIMFSVPNHTYGDAPFTVNASSNSTGPFMYSVLSGPATVTGNIVTLTGAGAVTLLASEAADGNYSAGSQGATFAVAKATPAIVWPAPTITYGSALGSAQLDASATGVGGAALAGTYAYTPAAGTVPAPSGETLSVLFTPTDVTDYNTATATTNLTVMKASLIVAANNATRVYGTVNPNFTGTVTGQQEGDTFGETFSTAAVQLSPVANYAIVPSVSGANLPEYTLTIQDGTLAITQAGTTATLTVSAQNILFGQNDTFTTTVTSLTSGTPTGTVQYLDNGVPFASAGLVSGQAILNSTGLGVGSHTITAVYSGDVNFTSNTATGPSIIVSVPDFTFTLTSPSLVTMHYYNAAAFTFHVTPLSGSYYQPVTFSYTGNLPLDAHPSFSPSTIAVNAGGADVTFTVSTSRTAWYRPAGATDETLLCFMILPLALALRLRRSLRTLPRLMMLGLLLVLSAGTIASLVGCGTGYADEVYPIIVTANSGGVVHTATVTVHILQTPQ
ncbi:MAG TPA: Ig-like domain repeat protein [Acidobacteriaceae bacterium]|nr:Ig-like domain repeat protein [Acidobacteriaceae bacterium]